MPAAGRESRSRRAEPTRSSRPDDESEQMSSSSLQREKFQSFFFQSPPRQEKINNLKNNFK
jgi:hypothetical protein